MSTSAKGLDSDHGTGHSDGVWDSGLEKAFEGFPATSAQLRQELSIVEGKAAENLPFRFLVVSCSLLVPDLLLSDC